MVTSINDDDHPSTRVVPDQEVEIVAAAAAAAITTTNENTTTIDGEQPPPPPPPQQRTVQVQGLPLDWTRLGVNTGNNDNGDDDDDVGQQQQEHPIVLRYPSDVTDINMDETELCIVGTAGQKITVIGNDFSRTTVNSNMESLILRSHIIRKMEGLQYFTNLHVLELYDNQIDALTNLNDGINGCPGSTLRTLDMSYNSIRDMAPVASCPNLQELYLANNKLRDMAGLKGLTHLKKLDLGANRIRTMDADELCGLVQLEDLWLGKNKIETIQGLEQLTKLRRLDVQSNRLTKIENLSSQCTTLEELFLSHNAITDDGASIPSGLGQSFEQLSIIDLSRNQLTTCQPFAHLITLNELWVSGNAIASFTDVEPLRNVTALTTIYLEYNPIQSEPLYRKKLAEVLPSLQQIDANMIGHVPYVSSAAGTTTATSRPSAIPPRIAETEEQRLRRLQDAVIARARQETYANNNDVAAPSTAEVSDISK